MKPDSIKMVLNTTEISRKLLGDTFRDHIKLRTLKNLVFRSLVLDNISAQTDKSGCDKLYFSRDSLYILRL